MFLTGNKSSARSHRCNIKKEIYFMHKFNPFQAVKWVFYLNLSELTTDNG